ncbi:39S ribosomal protein L10, mitochondrial-like [Homalodisca vitripennis]|nr:39S ribosomal protein L10, mitochondrial-like [Homalodisca vitripennis]
MENVAVSTFKGLLQINRGALRITVRNSSRVNVQKPRPPHYNRAKIEHLTRPKYFERGERDAWFIPSVSQCIKEKEEELKRSRKEEDNPYERLLAKDLRNWFLNSKLIAFFHCNPIRFDDRFEAEVKLRKEGMYLKKFGRHTVNMALEGTPYISVMPLFITHTEMVFCSEPKVSELLKVAGKLRQHVLLAAVVEDRLMSVSQLRALSDVKDLTTARARLVGVLNTAQSQLVSGLTYHQTSIAEGLRQYAEKPPDSAESSETQSS